MNKIQKSILEQLAEIIKTPKKGVLDGHYCLDLDQFDEGERPKEFSYLVDHGFIKREKHEKQWLYYISGKGIDLLEGRNTINRSTSGTGKQYIELFKKFETKLREIAGVSSDPTQFKDIIDKAKVKNPIVEYKEDLIWDLYGLRNVFAHCDREKYIAEVNDLAFKELNKLIELLEKPPKAGDVFKCNVFTAGTHDKTGLVLKTMQEKIYTHIPIYDNSKRFIGVLSESSILDWLVENIDKGKTEFYKEDISSINPKYLNLTYNKYKFVSADANVFEIQRLFEESIEKRERLGVILITQNGEKTEKLIGIVTAWDLPKIKEYLR